MTIDAFAQERERHRENYAQEHKVTTAILRFNFLSGIYNKFLPSTQSVVKIIYAHHKKPGPEFSLEQKITLIQITSYLIATGDKNLQSIVKHIKLYTELIPQDELQNPEQYGRDTSPMNDVDYDELLYSMVNAQERFAELMAEVSKSAFELPS